MATQQAVITPQTATLDRPVRRIQASRGFVPIDFAEIWRYRELLYYFLWRDVRSRYKQTYLGAFWALFRPFVTMILFTIIFNRVAGIDAPSGIPYALFIYPGILIWTYFSSCLTGGAASIINNAGLITKAYFPRLYAPMAAATAPIVDLFFSSIVLGVLFVYYMRVPSWHIVFVPFFILLTVLIGIGVGLWLSGITVRFRDAPYALPFVIQLWMYLTPVLFPVTIVPERYRWLLALNPMTSVVDGFRWCLIGITPPNILVLVISAVTSSIVLTGGLYYFHRVERTIVDLL